MRLGAAVRDKCCKERRVPPPAVASTNRPIRARIAMSELQVTKLRVEGFEDLRRVLDGADTVSVPLSRRVPSGTLFRASTGAVSLSVGQWCADVRTRGCISTNRVSLGLKLDLESLHYSFRSHTEVLPGDIYTLARGDDVDHRVSGRIRYAFVSLDPELLLRQGAEDAAREERAFWEKRRWFHVSPPMRLLIARSVQTLVEGVLEASAPVTGGALRQLEADLIEPFLWGFVFHESHREERQALSGTAIVRRVEDWVDGRPPAMIQLSELCRELRLSRRTLQRAFMETLGIGPARYLTLKRLAAVRAVLRQSDVTSATVLDVARSHGFWELRQFEKHYRRTFRESPTDTLVN
jgi:AraC family ethanolamine operon transcriptional activator